MRSVNKVIIYKSESLSFIPEFIVQSIPQRLDIDYDNLKKAHEEEAVTSIRMHPTKRIPSNQEMREVPWCSDGYYLLNRPTFTADPHFHAGAYYVQEASSMFLQEAFNQWQPSKHAIRVLDLCASPGGKSTLAVAQLPEDALLISNEVIKTRVNTLVENAVKWGYDNHWVSNNDARDFGKLEHFFDVLLVDAPCSGSGLFRKMSDYANEIKPEDVIHCALRQQRIVDDALPCLKQEGLLIYMTCSFSEEENERVLDHLCETHDLESLPLQVPSSWGIVESRSERHQAFGYRFFPHLVQGEGFFLAGFRKKGGEPRLELPHKNVVKPNSLLHERWVSAENKWSFPFQDMHLLIDRSHIASLDWLQKKLKLVKKGILLGKMAGKDFLPDHELAMYRFCSKELPYVELSREHAIAYLKKEAIPPLPEETDLGWLLVTFEGSVLGWIKNLGKRVNNYYPSNYRIISKNIV